MLRRRLITLLTFNDGILFRTKQFHPDYRYTLNFVDAWSVDEIVVLDVTRSGGGSREHFDEVVRDFARRCFVPMAAGGGVRTMDDVQRLLRIGADKIVVNTAAVERPAFVTEIAERYGTQCVVVSIDARRDGRGGYEVLTRAGSHPTGRSPEDWAREASDRGAGEILVTSIERDGSLEGYELDLCRRVVEAVDVPVLVAGGAGQWQHFVDGFREGGSSGVCTQNIFHFTESAIRSAKAYLARAGIDVRT